MILRLDRIFKGSDYTIGRLHIDDVYFCDTLEDTVRDVKIYGGTAIPSGEYKVILSKSPRFGRVLPEVLNVPNFTGIRIHRGNTAFDTHGCILVGINKEKGKVLHSTIYENLLVEKLKEQTDITIKIE